nr:polyketide synthase docking domain-containing protein [Micromonospora tarensis]
MSNEEKLLDYLKWVTADLASARERIHELESRDREPVAIVSMAAGTRAAYGRRRICGRC